MTADTVTAAALDVLGPQRVAAVAKLKQAEELATEAEREMVAADLADAAIKLTASLEQAQAATQAAQDALAGPAAAVEAAEARLADARQRAAAIASACLDDDLTVQLEAESLKVAAERIVERLETHLAGLRADLAPYQQALTSARAAEEQERALAAYVVQAIEDPLGHALGQAMPSYQLRLVRTWGQTILTGGQDHPEWGEALSWLRTALKVSGVGEQIQRDGILAYLAGDPAARSVSPGNKRWDDGTQLITSPDGPPLVTTRATPEQLRALPPRPAVDVSTGADVIAREWARSGAHREHHAGLPGANFPTTPRYPPAGGALSK